MNRNTRQSNIELLRIFSMLLIILHHYATHGGVYWNVNSGVNQWIATAMISFGKIGVNIFMIICGYFMVEQKFTWRKLLKIEIPVWFYSILFGLLAYFVFGEELSIKNVFCFLFPVLTNQGDQYWFVPCYMAVVLLSPAINKVVKELEKKTFKRVLWIAILLISVIPTLCRVTPVYDGNISLFVLLYLLGAFLRLYPETIDKAKSWVVALGVIVLSAFMIFGTVILKEILPYWLWAGSSILAISISLLLFVAFVKLPIKQNKWVNGIAATTFGIYLIHDNLYVRQRLWTQWIHCSDFYWSNKLWIHGVVYLLVVFFICMIIEECRMQLFRFWEWIYRRLKR